MSGSKSVNIVTTDNKRLLQAKRFHRMLKKILITPLVQIIALALLIIAGNLSSLCPWQSLENWSYDFWSSHFRQSGNQPIEIIGIDNASLQKFGDWPWPRPRIAEMVNLLSAAGAEGLGFCLLYTHPDLNPGLQEIKELKTQILDSKLKLDRKTGRILEGMLDKSEERLQQDDQLIAAVRRARNVVLPFRFIQGSADNVESDKIPGLLIINSLNAEVLPAPDAEAQQNITQTLNRGHLAPRVANGVLETFEELASKAGALGYLNVYEDPDGVLRRVPLLIEFKGRLFPAFGLQLALKSIDSRLRDISIETSSLNQLLINLKHVQLSTDAAFDLPINIHRQWLKQHSYSFSEVIEKTVDPAVFKNKFVLLGVTSKDIAPSYRLGSGARATSVEIAANVMSTILSPTRLSRPGWARVLEIAAILYFAFFLIFVIPRVNFRLGLSILAIFAATWYVMVIGLMLGYGYHVKWIGPVLLACCGFIAIQFTIYSHKRSLEKLEANKTLGLTYQGQGLLDMAYERFMLCPVDDPSIKNLLYNLALDFERKRMFNKALAIYRHIRVDGAFKDIDKRCDRLKMLDSTMALTASASRTDPPLITDNGDANPTFGRYEIIKELGRGSMGTVYLGRDPKINREVAIKTLAYADVGQSELKEVKTRFFREAEAAGKLSHPNIVAIYDVGEEHDMAYIAMELLLGKELTTHCKEGDLLPLPRALNLITEVSGALDYAHRQGVVHRDIKPANIMILEDGRIKVTDFGIAQVIDASKTKTGVILGTPNYMSPEQIAGENVDGRSDLFSLGIILYELLSGTKPFKGDTITAIMYAIRNTTHTPLLDFISDLPPCCDTIANKLLAKKPGRRYASADLVIKDIEKCLEALR